MSVLENQAALVDRIDALLPQTQCTKCGHAGCRPYAQAIVDGAADINQCPPGGQAGIIQLADLLQRQVLPLNTAHGSEGGLGVALIDEDLCIGCTLCIDACPVDAIVGAPKRMHTIVSSACTGCELCLPPCPTDCIRIVVAQSGRRWTADDARAARGRYTLRQSRLAQVGELSRAKRGTPERLDRSSALRDDAEQRKTVVAAALERARSRRRQAEQR